METPYELLIKYFRSKTTLEENQKIEEWLSKEDNHSLFLEFQKEWIFLKDTSIIELDKNLVWEKIQAKINQKRKKTKKLKLFRLMAVASIVLAVVVSSYFVYNNNLFEKQNTEEKITSIITKEKEKKEIVLEDGTKIWLNSNSKISYNNKYNIDNREVIVEGEFYFEVKPSNKKFIVKANKIDIEVLGTSFNLKSYFNEDIEISLKNGKIAVFSSDEHKQLFVMEPSQRLVIKKCDLDYISEIDNLYISDIWKESKLQIYNESFESVSKKLEVWYNIEIISKGLDFNEHYTFQLEKESLQEFLEIFSMTTPIEYKIYESKLYIEAKDLN